MLVWAADLLMGWLKGWLVDLPMFWSFAFLVAIHHWLMARSNKANQQIVRWDPLRHHIVIVVFSIILVIFVVFVIFAIVDYLLIVCCLILTCLLSLLAD